MYFRSYFIHFSSPQVQLWLSQIRDSSGYSDFIFGSDDGFCFFVFLCGSGDHEEVGIARNVGV
jgi:hypothetical protein